MTIPNIPLITTTVPTPPNRSSDSSQAFADKADATVAAWPGLVASMNTTAAGMNVAAAAMDAVAGAAQGSATAAATSEANALGSRTAAQTSATNAATSETNAASSAAAAAASAGVAAGFTATSATSLAIGLGAKSLTLAQTGRAFVVGDFVVVASTATPANFMTGQVTAFTSASGAMSVNVTGIGGSGTLASWNVSLSGQPAAPVTSGTLTGVLNLAASQLIASAATTNIAAATSNNVTITGTTTITALGTAAEGATRNILFAGSLTLIHNATSLILPGGADIVTVAGDTAEAQSLGSGAWRIVRYTRANGLPVVSGAIGDVVYTQAATRGVGWLKADGSVITKASYPDFAALNGIPINKVTDVTSTVTVAALTNGDAVSSVIKAGSLWIANVTGGRFYTSPDLVTWTLRATLGANYVASAMAYDGVNVMLCNYQGYVARSTDGGLTWSALAQKSPMSSYYNTGWGSAANLLVSSPGVILAISKVGSYNEETGPQYAVYINKTVDGGNTWTDTYICYGEQSLAWASMSAFWTGSKFVVFAGYGSSSWVFLSATGGTSTWTVRTVSTSQSLRSSGYASGRLFVALNNGTFYSEDDGLTWLSIVGSTPPAAGVIYQLGNAVVHSNNSSGPVVIDVTAKALTNLTGSFGGLDVTSVNQIDSASGSVFFPSATVGSNVKVAVFKPYTYDLVTQTALPAFNPLVPSSASPGAKSAFPFIRVL